MRTRGLSLAVFTVTALFFATPALAQRTTASSRGTVTDQTKAVVPGATITVTGQDTGFTQTTNTNSDGVYTFPQLPVGRYTVRAELQGFKPPARTDIALNVAA